MPLIDTRGYQLTPNVGQQLSNALLLGGQMQEQNLAQQQAQQSAQTRQLAGQLLTPGAIPQEQREAKQAELFAANPELGQKVFDLLGAKSDRQKKEAVDFAFMLRNTPMEKRPQLINQRIESLKQEGRNPQHTMELLDMDEAAQNNALDLVQRASLSVKERMGKEGYANVKVQGGKVLGLNKSTNTYEEIPVTEGAQKALVLETKKSPTKTVQSSKINEDGTVQVIYNDGSSEIRQPSEAEREIMQRSAEFGVDIQTQRAQGRGLGKNAAKRSDDIVDKIDVLRGANNNLRQVITEVRAGAGTGPLMSRLPSIRSASIRLDNLRNRAGLDVIGSVTFGALSESELNLALNTGLPTGLEGPELVEWAENKIASQEKLADYLEEQAIYLGQPGNTVNDWIDKRRTEQQEAAKEEVPQAEEQQAPPTAGKVGRFTVEVE